MDRLATLLVADDLNLKTSLSEALRGHEMATVLTVEEARERMGGDNDYSVILLDWGLHAAPLEDIKKLASRGTEPPIIAIVDEGDMESAASAVGAGAFDYIMKPLEEERVLTTLHKAADAGDLLSQALTLKPRFIGREDIARPIVALKELARETSPLLIRGEPGAGVDIMARALHFNGPRRDGPFVSAQCAALPPNLLESELFGYERGAVAGGVIRKAGHAELAEGGTLFIQEIGALSLHSQQRLFKGLQEGLLEPIGAESPLPWKCRVIASTEMDLEENIRSRMFREDLLRVLSVDAIYLAPLRERKEDIPELVKIYLEKYRKIHKRGPIIFSDTILRRLSDNPWQGNLKELQRTIERYVIAGAMPQVPRAPSIEEVTGIVPVSERAKTPPKPKPLREAARAAERETIINTLRECGGNKRMAARTLRISYKTLFNKLHQYRITTKTEYE